MTVSNTPLRYEDYLIDNGCVYIDDVSKISATMFINTMVRCPCTGKTYNNKYTFLHQHCKTKKHRAWIGELSENRDSIIKTSIERAKDIKQLRIKLEKETRKNKRLEKQLREIVITENNAVTECDSLKEEISSLKSCLHSITTECETLKHKLKDATLKKQKFEAWIKIGARDIMEVEWESDSEMGDSSDG